MNRYGLGLRDHLEKSLQRMGYKVISGILKARDYGVPQIRRRFICLGVKKEILGSKMLSLPPPTWDQDMINKELSTSQVIGDLDVYEKRGGYGTGEDFGPENYLKPASSNFQKEMRKVRGTTKGKTHNTKSQTIQNTYRKECLCFKRSFKDELLNTDLETKKHSQRALITTKLQTLL